MQTKTSTIIFTGCLVLVLLAGAFAGGVFVGWVLPRTSAQAPLAQGSFSTATPRSAVTVTLSRGGSVTLTPAPGSITTPQTTTTPDLQSLFAPFWQSWNLVHQQFVNQPVDDTTLMRGAIRGMMDSLGDPHTSYSDPKAFTQEMSDLTGSVYEGIGAWVDTTGSYLKIISPMPDSPAFNAGVKSGDIIIAVDKKEVTGLSGTLVLEKVLGPAGTTVTLTIQRGTAEPRSPCPRPNGAWRKTTLPTSTCLSMAKRPLTSSIRLCWSCCRRSR